MAIISKIGLSKKIKIKIKKNKWLLVCQNLYELSLVLNSDCLLLIKKKFSCISYC